MKTERTYSQNLRIRRLENSALRDGGFNVISRPIPGQRTVATLARKERSRVRRAARKQHEEVERQAKEQTRGASQGASL